MRKQIEEQVMFITYMEMDGTIVAGTCYGEYTQAEITELTEKGDLVDMGCKVTIDGHGIGDVFEIREYSKMKRVARLTPLEALRGKKQMLADDSECEVTHIEETIFNLEADEEEMKRLKIVE